METENKAVLISIQPKWCELIASGEKTIEVRKTKPKLKPPFKCYIYCTKDKNNHFWTGKRYSYADDRSHNAFDKDGNGKVIGEFVCDKIEYFNSAASKFAYSVAPSDIPCTLPMSEEKALETCYQQGCLSINDVISYFGEEDWEAYFWHISGLKIYDEPKELSKFGLTRPPQSWCYFEEVEIK